MPAECEIENCGVLAVGRCIDCGHAFCPSHQQIGQPGPILPTTQGPVTNLCAECGGKRSRQYWQAQEDGHPLARSGRVLKWFRDAGIPSEPLFATKTVERSGWRRSLRVQVVEQVGVCWQLGDAPWSFFISETAQVDRPVLIALTDYEHPTWCVNGYGYEYGVGYKHGIVQVSRIAQGLLSHGYMGFNERTEAAATRLVRELLANHK